jgi:hypothetical protein
LAENFAGLGNVRKLPESGADAVLFCDFKSGKMTTPAKKRRLQAVAAADAEAAFLASAVPQVEATDDASGPSSVVIRFAPMTEVQEAAYYHVMLLLHH